MNRRTFLMAAASLLLVDISRAEEISPEEIGKGFLSSVRNNQFDGLEKITLEYRFTTCRTFLHLPVSGIAGVTLEKDDGKGYVVKGKIKKMEGFLYHVARFTHLASVPDINTTIEGIIAVEDGRLVPRRFMMRDHTAEEDPHTIDFYPDSIIIQPGNTKEFYRGYDPLSLFFNYMLADKADTVTDEQVVNFKDTPGVDITMISTRQEERAYGDESYSHVMSLSGTFLNMIEGDVAFSLERDGKYRIPVRAHVEKMNGDYEVFVRLTKAIAEYKDATSGGM